MLSAMVYDVIDATRVALAEVAPADADAVRAAPPLVRFSADMRQRSQALKQFLFANLYRHPQVVQTTGQARQIIQELFAVYGEAPQEMQSGFAARASVARDAARPASALARVVADYIAGMTDRFATREHERLTGVRLLP